MSLSDYAILLSDQKYHQHHFKKVYELLVRNNYPSEFITKHIYRKRLQTGAPTDAIARRIRVKRVGRYDGARCFCSYAYI